MPKVLLTEMSWAVRDNGAAARKLAEFLHAPDRAADAIASSILLKVNPLWRPWSGRPLLLWLAQLDGAKWDKIDLQDTILDDGYLRHADLSEANLNRVRRDRRTLIRPI